MNNFIGRFHNEASYELIWFKNIQTPYEVNKVTTCPCLTKGRPKNIMDFTKNNITLSFLYSCTFSSFTHVLLTLPLLHSRKYSSSSHLSGSSSFPHLIYFPSFFIQLNVTFSLLRCNIRFFSRNCLSL